MRLLTSVLLLMAAAAVAAGVDVGGDWNITIQSDQGTFSPRVTFKQDGEKLTGDYHGTFGESKLEGTLKGKDIEWKTTISAQGQAVQITYTGTVESGDTMKGTVQLGEFGSAPWTARRKAKEK